MPCFFGGEGGRGGGVVLKSLIEGFGCCYEPLESSDEVRRGRRESASLGSF